MSLAVDMDPCKLDTVPRGNGVEQTRAHGDSSPKLREVLAKEGDSCADNDHDEVLASFDFVGILR